MSVFARETDINAADGIEKQRSYVLKCSVTARQHFKPNDLAENITILMM